MSRNQVTTHLPGMAATCIAMSPWPHCLTISHTAYSWPSGGHTRSCYWTVWFPKFSCEQEILEMLIGQHGINSSTEYRYFKDQYQPLTLVTPGFECPGPGVLLLRFKGGRSGLDSVESSWLSKVTVIRPKWMILLCGLITIAANRNNNTDP